MLLIVSRSKFVRMNESVNERLSLSIKEYLALKKELIGDIIYTFKYILDTYNWN